MGYRAQIRLAQVLMSGFEGRCHQGACFEGEALRMRKRESEGALHHVASTLKGGIVWNIFLS